MRIAALFIVIQLNTAWANQAPQFTYKQDLPPIKITYERLFQILKEINHLKDKYDPETIKDGEISFIIETGSASQTFEFLPSLEQINLEKAFAVNYQYLNYRGNISKIDLWFGDYSRTITVRGQNITEVQSIVDKFDREFMESSTWFGGFIFRMILYFLIIFVFIFMKFEFSKEGSTIKITESRGLKSWASYPLLIFIITAPWGIYGLESIFPGFVIYRTDTSFISKYADYFTFFGFILGLLTLFGIDKKIKKLHR